VPRSENDTPSAVERADALLTRWEQRLTPGRAAPPPAVSGKVRPAGGRGLMWPVARGYVWLSARVQDIVGPIQQSWQQSVAEARREQEQQAARRGGPGAARREAGQEKQGEGTIKKTAGATAEAASTATEAAGG